MASNELVNFFNIMFDKRQAFDIAEGILQDKRGLTGRVSFVGNPVSQPVFIMGSAKDVSVGNRCLCVRPKTSSKWIVIGSFGTQQTGYLPQRSPEDGYEIYPPRNLTAESILPDSCLWHWDSPPEKAIVFEIQTNTSADEDGAVTKMITRGSYYIEASLVHLFIRIRSITSTYNHSSWSEWVECAPGDSAGGGGGSGTVESVVAGTHISVDSTDPANPIVSATGLVDSVTAGTDISVNNTDPNNPIISWSHDIATQKIIGRYTPGSGHFEELSLGTGLYISGSGLYASATSTGIDLTNDTLLEMLWINGF